MKWLKKMRTVQSIKTSLPEELAAELHEVNPWWLDKPAPRTPPFRRWIFDHLQSQFTSGMAPAVLLRGPRRVGKTVLVRQLIAELLKSGVNGNRILYVPFDELKHFSKLKLNEPILGLARWFQQQVLGETFNESARANRIAYLLFDEAQNLKAWAPQLKHLVDNHEVRALVTGSSSLRIDAGRDSLAGRVTTLTIGTLLLREIAAMRFGQACEPLLPAANSVGALLQREFWEEARTKGRQEREARFKAFQAFSERGGYPAAQLDPDLPWEAMVDQLNESVIMKVRPCVTRQLAAGNRTARLAGTCRQSRSHAISRTFG
jgi:predicted AAA+ superfamily ATPase